MLGASSRTDWLKLLRSFSLLKSLSYSRLLVRAAYNPSGRLRRSIRSPSPRTTRQLPVL